MRFRAKNCVIWEKITLLRANQIARITSDFKMDVIKRKILALLQCALTLAKQATGKLLSWYLDKVRDNNVLQ